MTVAPPKSPVGVPPPNTTTAAPAGTVVLAPKVWRTLFPSARVYPEMSI